MNEATVTSEHTMLANQLLEARIRLVRSRLALEQMRVATALAAISAEQDAVDPSSEPATAVIVEPRRLKVLRRVLRNFLTNLPPNWTILVFHGTENQTYVERILETDLAEFQGRVELRSLHRANLDPRGHGPNSYNGVMMSRELLDQIPTERFLVFQSDSLLCSRYKDLLKVFLSYDYVGAPWAHTDGGNGGLSLRRKSKMLEILEKVHVRTDSEDVFFSTGRGIVPVHNPPKELAKLFSIETQFSPVTWGIHNAWRYLPKHQALLEAMSEDYAAIRDEQGIEEDG